MQTLCLTRGVSPEPSPVPGTLQSLNTGLLNACVTEGEWNPIRQLSLNVLHGSTKHIHCLNRKCCKICVHLSSLSYLKAIPFSYLCFTESLLYWGALYSNYCGGNLGSFSQRENSLLEGTIHLSTQDKISNLKQAFVGRCSSVKQLMSLFNEFFASLKMVNIPMFPDLIKLCLYPSDCKLRVNLEKSIWKCYRRKMV